MLLPSEDDVNDRLAADRLPIRQPSHRNGFQPVLVVDDEPQVRSFAKAVLRADGYTVLEARDAIEALLVTDRHRGPIDLLLADVNLPRTNGHQLAAKLRGENPALKVLLSRGDDGQAAVARAAHGPAVRFLPKPFGFARLTATVRDALAD